MNDKYVCRTNVTMMMEKKTEQLYIAEWRSGSVLGP